MFQPVYCAEVLEDYATRKTLLSKLGDLAILLNKGYFDGLANQPFRIRAYIEMYLAKYLEDAKTDTPLVSLNKFEVLLNAVIKYIVQNHSSLGATYQVNRIFQRMVSLKY